MGRQWIILDCETRGRHDAADFIEPVAAPANYKDEAKKAAYIEEEFARRVNAAALDVHLAEIVTVAYRTYEAPTRVLTVGDDGLTERDLVQTVGDLCRYHRPIVGFNVLGYDLPLLVTRAFYLDVLFPTLDLRKWGSPDVCDVMEVLSFGDPAKRRSLKFYSRLAGIEPSIIDPLNSGADAATASTAELAAHCMADVERTYRLALKRRLIDATRALARPGELIAATTSTSTTTPL